MQIGLCNQMWVILKQSHAHFVNFPKAYVKFQLAKKKKNIRKRQMYCDGVIFLYEIISV